MHASRYGRGTVLRIEADEPSLEATAVHDAGAGLLTVFAVNRSAEPLSLIAAVRALEDVMILDHVTLTDPDLNAANTADDPDRVRPRRIDTAHFDGAELQAHLPPRSWNVLRLSHA
jgi:alpha-L-arabinofuranosidase